MNKIFVFVILLLAALTQAVSLSASDSISDSNNRRRKGKKVGKKSINDAILKNNTNILMQLCRLEGANVHLGCYKHWPKGEKLILKY